ncbi:hypothetical protein L1987_82279 [Smallanthus sonchifolius]|uniref:Uncharacterized protein n=1 Tax=Smallanthus sonchifolius TaxID=185202 RepID=A0ACB8YAD0_9ASTR|nr:hypothetical protein L1987_82279 [Smallanthus sonchifolius]
MCQVIHPPLWHIAQVEQDLCKWKPISDSKVDMSISTAALRCISSQSYQDARLTGFTPPPCSSQNLTLITYW